MAPGRTSTSSRGNDGQGGCAYAVVLHALVARLYGVENRKNDNEHKLACKESHADVRSEQVLELADCRM